MGSSQSCSLPRGERAGERHPMAFATAEPRHRTCRKLAQIEGRERIVDTVLVVAHM